MLEHEVNYPDYSFKRTEKTINGLPEGMRDSLKRIEQGRIIDLVTEIGSFYDLPENIYMDGIGIPVFCVDVPMMRSLASNHPQDLTSFGVTTELSGNEFIAIRKNDIYDEKEVLVHELLHAIKKTKVTSLEAQKPPHRSRVTEAAVTILQYALLNKDIPLLIDEDNPNEETLFRKILRKEIVVPYDESVVAMLTLMQGTERGSNPMTLKELAKMYFSEDKFFTLTLMLELGERIPDEYASYYRDCFKSLPW